MTGATSGAHRGSRGTVEGERSARGPPHHPAEAQETGNNRTAPGSGKPLMREGTGHTTVNPARARGGGPRAGEGLRAAPRGSPAAPERP